MAQQRELTSKSILVSYSNAFRDLSADIVSAGLGSKKESQLLLKRAQLISNLEIAVKYASDFNTVDTDVLLTISSLSRQANHILELENPGFGLRVLLTSMGDTEDDPNHLDVLISKL